MSYPNNIPPNNAAEWSDLPDPDMLHLSHQPLHPRLHAAWSILRATFKYPHLISPDVFTHIHALDSTETVDGKPTIDFEYHYNAVIVALNKIPERLPTFNTYVGFILQGMDRFQEEWRLAVLKPLVEKLEEEEEEGVPMIHGEGGLRKKVKVEPELFFDNVNAADRLMKDLQLAMRDRVSSSSRNQEAYEKTGECSPGDDMSATWYDAAEKVERGDGAKGNVEEESEKLVAARGDGVTGDEKANEAASEKREGRKVWGEGRDAGKQDDSAQLDALDNLFELGPQCVVF